MTLDELYRIIQDRKTTMPDGSYVASLFRDGKDRILEKIGEEATEVIVAAKNENSKRQIEEIADLLFHVTVLLVALTLKPKDVFDELTRRNTVRAK